MIPRKQMLCFLELADPGLRDAVARRGLAGNAVPAIHDDHNVVTERVASRCHGERIGKIERVIEWYGFKFRNLQ
ncbi:Os03g0269500 [Oryza sativa Japonica Group]|uniref:Os03g0269500 protein n=1 Tax=Oryza sativa subsp. japonica TaxID=39947 RepID=A0A0P0VVV8_ORYSJ|nr:hypothetical protein EE612_016712 [Oryza sativa]BAS83458.1 Os03g0269500 [Oryza sativa Japonica Group]